MENSGDKVAYHWEWTVRSSAAKVWPYVSDTDRLNRVLGLPAVEWAETPLPEGGSRRTGSFRLAGICFEWEEHPFQWRENQAFSVFRPYSRGPIKTFEARVVLKPDGQGTRLGWDIILEPVNPFLAPVMRIIATRIGRELGRLHQRLDQMLQGGPAVVFPPESVSLALEAPARMAAIGRELARLDFADPMIKALMTYIRTAGAQDVHKMRPFFLADVWELPRMSVLKLFLHATRQGLLDLSWDLICPQCRGAKESGGNLSDLTESAHCGSCNVDFEANFSQSVELTFKPNAAIRPIGVGEYCVGGPQNTPHVVAQALLAPGENTVWDLVLLGGAYRLRGPQAQGYAMFEVVKGTAALGASNSVVLELGAEGLGGQARAFGPEVKVEVRNASSAKHLLVLERIAWASHVVTADFVGTLPEFRSLFSDQVLAPGVRVKVARLAFLFSDLKSSTAMYEEQGDAKAFALVRDHFKVMDAPIAGNGGAVVKTIGDAVMAVFTDAGACVRAGQAVHDAIAVYNAQSGEIPLVVKLGAHVGACLAVNLDGRLDYFGTTVNVAARVQGESVGDDFVLTQAMMADPGVMRLLADLPYETEEYDIHLKGLTDAFRLTRLWPFRKKKSTGELAQGRLPEAEAANP